MFLSLQIHSAAFRMQTLSIKFLLLRFAYQVSAGIFILIGFYSYIKTFAICKPTVFTEQFLKKVKIFAF
jgi:hypothetical protein